MVEIALITPQADREAGSWGPATDASVRQGLARSHGDRTQGDVGMDGYRARRRVHLAIDPVELVAPDLFEMPRVDEAVAVGRRLDEHHRREIVEVPAARDLDQVGHLAALQRFHPMRCGL